MGYRITEFEDTPNPNAVKCWVDPPISEGMRSFLNRESAREDPVADALFEVAGAECVLFGGDWITVNKKPSASWSTVKNRIRKVLDAAVAGSPGCGTVGDASRSGTSTE